jgi:hypothetical protein
MDRRSFIASAAAGVAAGIAPAGPADAIHDQDSDLADGLCEVLATWLEDCGFDLDEEEWDLETSVSTLLAASQWGRDLGITFRWLPMPDSGFHARAEDCVDEDTGERLLRCLAIRDGRIIGHSDGWFNTTPADPHVRLWAESDMVLALMRDYATPRSNWIYTDPDGVRFDFESFHRRAVERVEKYEADEKLAAEVDALVQDFDEA